MSATDGSRFFDPVEGRIDEQYRRTEERLATDPEWIALKEAAEREAVETPNYYLARNMLAVRREIETPLWGAVAE